MRHTLPLALLGIAAVPVVACGQQASQHGVVAQTVNETVITMEYDRPVARGRELFGEIIDWDAIWTPGANVATWIEFSTPVTFEGHALEAGRYAIWMIPAATGIWEVMVVDDWDTHHSFFPFESEEFRTEIQVEQGAHMETLAFYFPVVGPNEATLRMHWGTTIVPMQIEVGR